MNKSDIVLPVEFERIFHPMPTGDFPIRKPSLLGCGLGPTAGGLCCHPSMHGMTTHAPRKRDWYTMVCIPPGM